MGSLAKILSLSYDSAVATKTSALKTYYRSVRLIKNTGAVNPSADSKYTNILLCGNCVDPETRNLYVSYIDTSPLGYAWIIEINIDSRRQNVVYFDKYNAIGFNPKYKFRNMRVVHGRLVWTDNFNPIYQMDIARAKRSFQYRIGYGQYPTTVEWDNLTSFGIDQPVSNGNYFYKSKIDHNAGIEPRFDSGTNWEKLCLIEDAYYSMDVKNFYFEPVPPMHPPEVTYQSDDTRKINNLRQTLFQVCYRYVYMDWRKSTFSPASIVPVPQAEEETATGLANEQISLNNKLQVVVNSGGEEVRAIEIVGRSSQDPARWFLIETINKFESQERGNEISRTSEAEFVTLGISLPLATAIGVNNPNPGDNTIGLGVREPFVLNTWVASSLYITGWTAAQYGDSLETSKIAVITSNYNMAQISAIPDWITVLYYGMPLYEGMSINCGVPLSIFPKTPNLLDVQRSGSIKFSNLLGDAATINFIQAAVYIPPSVPVAIITSIDSEDTSGMTIRTVNGLGMSNSKTISLYLIIDHPSLSSGGYVDIFWRAVVNGNSYGNGILVDCLDELPNNRVLTLDTALAENDLVIVYISTQPILIKTISQVGMFIAPLPADVINSEVLVSQGGLFWDAIDYDSGDSLPIVVSCPPTNCTITSKPNWLTIYGIGGYYLGAGATIANGETIILFPTVENTGGELSGYVILTNSFGDSASIYVKHAATLVPPTGTPVPCSILKYSGDYSSMTIPISSAAAVSGNNRVSWSCVLTGFSGSTIYWRAYKTGSTNIQGSGSFSAHYGSNSGTLVLDNVLLVGDVITIYFSSVTF